VLLVGFAGAMRRSELSALSQCRRRCGDGEGLWISPGAVQDRSGRRATVGIAYGSNPATCPVWAWRDIGGEELGLRGERAKGKKFLVGPPRGRSRPGIVAGITSGG